MLTGTLLPDETLASLSATDKLDLLGRVSVSLATQVAHPDDWYAELARYSHEHSADWGTSWTDDDVSPEPIPPENMHETLAGSLHSVAKIQRALDNTMVTLAVMADRAVKVDREKVLGIPAGITTWRTGHSFIADQLGIEIRQAAQFKDRAELVAPELSTVDRPAGQPLLPKVSTAYRAGRIPSENIDSIVRSLKTITKYLRLVGLSPEQSNDVVSQLDQALVDAAVAVKPRELSKMTDDILAQVAAIVDADGPPPAEVLNTMQDSLDYRIVNGKLKIEILTDVVNLELLLGIIYAGLNFRSHQNRYHADPQTAKDVVDDVLHESPQPESEQSFLADLKQDLGENPSDEQLVAAAKSRLDKQIREQDVSAETMDGQKPTRDDMKRIDPRSRSQRQHDVFVAFLRATGRLDPSIHGLRLFGGSATQLRIALDYQTMTDQLAERLPEEFHLEEQFRRPDGMAGFDPGSPRFLQGITLAPEQLIELEQDDGRTLIEISVGADAIRIPKPQRGHPFISRGLLSGNIPPQHLRAQLCDAQVIPQILGSGGVVLDKGRAVRTFPNHLKEDLALRGACSIPNCRSPVAWCDGHHLIWWSHNGLTNPSNQTLVCTSCHPLVHKGVWTPVLDAQGELYWKPARWLDPTQTPIRNTYWD